MEEIDDDQAIQKAIQGDPEAFSALYERFVSRIYNYIYYRTGSPYDAEDLTERVFLRALAHIQTYNNRGVPFSAWLYRIAHNLVANWHRDNSRRKEVPLEDQKNLRMRSEQPEVELVQNQEQESLLQAIRKLPEDRQQLIILKFVEHLSNSEVATIMNRSEGAIKSLYHRTLLTLRELIEKRE
jgi:RNA polymerase sigma-70 factor (ECF subfamily)